MADTETSLHDMHPQDRLLFEDGEALVIDKPAGLPVDRPRAGGLAVEDWLELLHLGFLRPPLAVHRLDRDTSGCLLLARNPKAAKRFSQAFEARQVDKVYWGVIAGAPPAESGTIDLALSKVSTAAEGWRMIAAKRGKPSVTHWRTLAEQDGRSLIEFRPETGRTHQIRIHAQHGLGAALLGDPIYGPAHGQNIGAARTLLHARSITLHRDPKPPVHAVAPMPADFPFDAAAFGDGPMPAAPIENEPDDGA